MTGDFGGVAVVDSLGDVANPGSAFLPIKPANFGFSVSEDGSRDRTGLTPMIGWLAHRSAIRPEVPFTLRSIDVDGEPDPLSNWGAFGDRESTAAYSERIGVDADGANAGEASSCLTPLPCFLGFRALSLVGCGSQNNFTTRMNE